MTGPQNIPVVRILIPFLIGIVIGKLLEVSFLHALAGVVFATALWLLIKKYFRNTQYSGYFILYLPFFISLGVLAYSNTLPNSEIYTIGQTILQDNNVHCIIEVNGFATKKKSIHFDGVVKQIVQDSLPLNFRPFKVKVYADSILDMDNFEYGNHLVVKGYVNAVSAPATPYSFDYRQYLSDQDVYYQLYIKQVVGDPVERSSRWYEKISIDLRKKCLSLLKNHLDTKEYGIAAALVLGYRNDLDSSTREQFINAGVIHVLAVSGLHVGFVTMFLLWVMKVIFRGEKRFWGLQMAILVTALVVFSQLAGGATPISRASWMFGFLALGKLTPGNKNRYNVLALVAFVVLIFDPRSLFSVSFQLSFAAVISIIFFYPYIYKRFFFSNQVANFFWQITAVGIAVQFLTFPLTLYYFHQYPLYFIISGLVAIPAAMLILGFGFGLFFLSFSASASGVIGFILNTIVYSFREFVETVSSLPHSIIEKVWIDSFQLVLLFVCVFGIMKFLADRRAKGLIISLISTLCFLLWVGIVELRHSQQLVYQEYSTKQHFADVIVGKTAYEFSESRITNEQKAFAADEFRMAHGVTKIVEVRRITLND